MNGQPAKVINAIGWPGSVDTYRLDFQVPAEAAKGMATIQVSAPTGVTLAFGSVAGSLRVSFTAPANAPGDRPLP